MHEIYLGLGSNTEPEHYLKLGLDALQQTFTELHCSPVFESKAVGINSANFYNLVVKVTTEQSLAQVIQCLNQIEQQNGRYSEQKLRITLDIDILLFDELVINAPIVLPRQEILNNAFVLWPLALLAGDKQHPQQGEKFANLWQQSQIEQQLWPVAFNWHHQALTPDHLLQSRQFA